MIKAAIVLAAGEGSRLRAASASKPLCEIHGKSLVGHAIHGLAAASIERVIVVTGYRAEDVEGHIALSQWPVDVRFARTPDWRQPNGISARAAATVLDGEDALLVMCDHLVEPALYARLAAAGAGPGLRLGIDRRLGHPWVDPEDVTCVATKAGRITAIGKGLEPHDAYDTGVFAVGASFFEALATLDMPSITEAVRVLAARFQAEIVDCGDLLWLDVDDPRALALARDWGRTLGNERLSARG